MRPFHYRKDQLYAGAVSLASLAKRYGTPLYVYDFDAIARQFQEFERAFSGVDHLVCASVKANSNLTLLRGLASWGAGFDVVSGGELERVLRAGATGERVVFSGVGKSVPEMDAALQAGILLFNAESEPELELLAERAARLRRKARFGLRVNPDVAADTHPHIATGRHAHKFGVTVPQALRLYRRYASSRGAARWMEPSGISFHIGSQILTTAPFAAAVNRVRGVVGNLEDSGIHLRYFDAGGGLGISYRSNQSPPSLDRYARALMPAVKGSDRVLLLEPGRRLVAAAGTLVTEVLFVKETTAKRFVIVDAASNDLIRPSLYGAYHEIMPVRRNHGRRYKVDVVGPICETGDTLARDRLLPKTETGDLWAILDTGAYGFAQSSNYNTRCRAAEVAVQGGKATLIRRRETLDDLLGPEITA